MQNENLALYLVLLIALSAVFVAWDASISLLVFVVGFVGWWGFELVLWLREKLRGKKKRR